MRRLFVQLGFSNELHRDSVVARPSAASSLGHASSSKPYRTSKIHFPPEDYISSHLQGSLEEVERYQNKRCYHQVFDNQLWVLSMASQKVVAFRTY